jgi:amino acid adenylation domain-containing protein
MTRIGYAAKGSSLDRNGQTADDAGAPVPPRRTTSNGGGSTCSFAQEQFWYVDQLSPGTVAYNFSWAIRLRGPLDLPALERAVAEIVRRHEALRTRFVPDDGRPTQVVDGPRPFRLPVVDLADGDRPEETARRVVAEQGRRPFDLSSGEPFRARLFRLADSDHILQLVVHHIVVDEWSKVVLLDELSVLYQAFVDGHPSPLPEPRLQLADFAEWQRSRLTDDVLAAELAYWTRELAAVPTVLELPTDLARPPVASLEGAKLRLALPARLTAALEERARTEGATFFDGILSLFQILIHRYTGQEDFVVGVPVDDRVRPELEETVGVLLSTAVVRSDLEGMPTFRELLRRVRQRVLGVSEHADLPFELLVRELQPERDLSRHPLFQVLLAVNPAEPELRLPGIAAEELETEVAAAGVDLFLFLQEVDGGFDALWEYSTDLFARETIERIHRHFVALLEAAVETPDTPVDELPMLAEDERDQLLVTWNDTAADYPSEPLHALVEALADRTPGEIAITFDGRELTYGELEQRANQLARHLQSLGVGIGSLVGISLDRSPELVVGLLGILKAGGAYVPLDPELPPERLAFMLADSGAGVLLTQEHLAVRLPPFAGLLVSLDADWPEIARQSIERPGTEVGPEDVAYVIYTSGSTGKPKGVLNTHAGIVNRLLAMQDTYRIDASDRLLQKTQTSFDVSVREIFWPLIFGARLVVAAPGEHGNPAYLARVIEREQVTTLHFVPSMLSLFLDETDSAKCRSLRSVLSGGEALTPDLRRRFFDRLDCELHNLYGPTEAAVSVTSWQCQADDERQVVPIGRPIANTQIYIVDSRFEPAPIGVWGELLIGGVQVARGYHRRPDLTAEKFVSNPFGEGVVYRTGDLGRWNADGVLEYGGRIDEQVKLRGFRIELGEIEAVLRDCPAVADGAVVVVETAGGGRELAAYAVPATDSRSESAAEDVHRFLGAQLPDYMLPSSITFLDALPLSPSGKLDRKALPAPDRSLATLAYTEPETATEQTIAELWGTLLEVDRVGRDDNFFRLGGHSLLAARLVGRVSKEFEVELPLCNFLQAPTVAALAREVQGLEGTSTPELPPLVPRGGVREASFAQERFWFVEEVMGSSAAYNIPVTLRLRGELDAEALSRALTEIVRRHEILRTRFAVEDGRPMQLVEPPFTVTPTVTDLNDSPTSAQRVVDELTQTPIELTRRVLFTVDLLRLDEREHVLHLVFSHVVFDGWSKLVLLRELSTLYNAFRRGAPSPLEELGLQFADFAEWQRSWLEGELLERELAHWTTALEGTPEALELPTDLPRPEVASMRGAWMRRTVPASVVDGLQALARSEGATFYMALLAVFDTLLHRYSGQDDIVVGMPVEGRDRPELEGSIGVFVDTVVLRVDTSGNPTLRELIARVRTQMLDAIAHQRLPFEQLVRALAPDRQLARHPLYQVMLTLVPAETAPELDDLEVDEVAAARASSPIDLTVFLEPHGSEYQAVWEYSTDLFTPTTIERMQSHFQQLLASAIAEPDRPIDELEMLSEAEREEALTSDDASPGTYPVACLHELFEARAAAAPDAPAVVYEGETLSYADLNRRANRLAHRLRSLGVGPETLVALCLERSHDLVVAVLAVLKAGGAYVPLDPDYPAERLAFVLTDARPKVLLTHERLLSRLPAHEATVLCVEPEGAPPDELDDANPEPLARPDNLAYVIYTSGSTGQPKGVQVEHRHVARLFSATDEWFGFGHEDTWLLFHSYAFDFSVWELWGALLHGGRLVVAPLWTTRSPESLARLVADQKVTVLNATPTLFVSAQEDLLRIADDLALRYVVFGGEALHPSALRPWYALFGDDGPKLVNMYGITETTVHVTYRPLSAADAGGDVSPIGRPILDLQLYLLDAHLKPVAPGVPGELFVGGAGVARGYLNRPELTAERFLPNPFGEGTLYRSGDRARYRADGELEFLGRADDQVKIRGFRVELGEIQAALSEHEAVAECAVVPYVADAGDTRLAAYVVPSADAGGAVRRILREQPDGESADAVEKLRNDLRARAEERLPLFMVPSSITLLAALPLTPNGKLDRKALPPPIWEEQSGAAFMEPQTPTAVVVAEIWQRILGVERVGHEDNFFRLGGHSLLAARAVTQVRERFGIEISVRALFEHPTLDAFSAAVAALAGDSDGEADTSTTAPARRTYPPAFSQRPLLIVNELADETATYNGAFALKVVGELDSDALQAALAGVVARHEALRTVFTWDSDEPEQVILEEWQSALPVTDLTSYPAEQREAELQLRLRTELRRPFDLARDLLVRTTLFRLSESEHVLVVVTHHIASDGWSVGIFCRDLGELYEAKRADRPPQLPALPLQYRDFAIWQRERLSGERLEREVDYWRAQLAGAPTSLQLPTDRPRPTEQAFDGASLAVTLPGDVAAAVLRLSTETGATPYMVLLSVFGLLLYRETGQDDILMGSPYANRARTEFDDLIGFFANTLALRVRLAGNPTYAEFLARVREMVLGALDHQEFPFEHVVAAIRPTRQPGMNPLVQINFRASVGAPPTAKLAGAVTSRLPLDLGFAAFDLALDLHVLEDQIVGEFLYDIALFDRESVERLSEVFTGILRQVVDRPDRRLLDFEVLAARDESGAAPTGGPGIRGFRDRDASSPLRIAEGG